MRRISLALLGLLAGSSTATNIQYRSLGQIEVSEPAFVKVGSFKGQKDFLLISQF
jgi:hypothetical protein